MSDIFSEIFKPLSVLIKEIEEYEEDANRSLEDYHPDAEDDK